VESGGRPIPTSDGHLLVERRILSLENYVKAGPQ
jgi:hypothetical protein